MKFVICHVIVLLALLSLGCNQAENEGLKEENKKLSEKVAELEGKLVVSSVDQQALQFLAAQLKGVKARLITNMGDIELEFFADKAPIHCFNFVTRAEGGFYDNSTFHRVIKGFMIQGGDPLSKDDNPNNDGMGGPIASIPHEFNETSHTPGILSMARVGDVNAGAGCQFFIMHGTAKQLDGQYTAFGKVTRGIEVVNKIADTKTGANDRPANPVVIKTIEVSK
jgi:peptidyl-prolyl cis-trans isomerase B (cyclophilin B)